MTGRLLGAFFFGPTPPRYGAAQMQSQNTDSQVLSISDFCKRNRISRSTFHKLKKSNRAPREIRLGRAIRISLEAEQVWRRDREMPMDAEARLIKREAEARTRQAHKAGKAAAASPKHFNKAKTEKPDPKAGR